MMDSDDDDLYDPVDSVPYDNQAQSTKDNGDMKVEDVEEDEEEGEEIEEDDSDDEDVTFITDAKDDIKPEHPAHNKSSSSAAVATPDARRVTATPTPGTKSETALDSKARSQSANDRPGTDYPARHTSTIDPNGNPVHPVTGKPILSTDFDSDFPGESSKPWRKPGADITDYFNYDFDEFTWASYCLKQQKMPKEIKEINDQAEYMKAFVEGIPGAAAPGMPGILPNVPAGTTAPAPNGTMPPMPGMPSEADMQQVFAGMMAQGMDPSTMDPSQFMQMVMGGGAAPGGGLGFGGQGSGFGSGQPAGQQQQMGFGTNAAAGYDQGGFAGRGRSRGGRRNW